MILLWFLFTLASFCLASVCNEEISKEKKPEYVSLPNTRSPGILLNSIAPEVKDIVFSFLTHEMCAFGLTCRSLHDDLGEFYEKNIHVVAPSFSSSIFGLKALIYFYVLKNEPPKFLNGPISEDDFLHLCVIKAQYIDETRSEKITKILKNFVGLSGDKNTIPIERFSNLSLIYTIEYMIKKGDRQICAGGFYEIAVSFPRGPQRTIFLAEVAATYSEPERSLTYVFDAEFATILFSLPTSSPAFQSYVLRVSSARLYLSPSISPELISKLAAWPALFKVPVDMLDSNRYMELNKDWIRCVLLTPSTEQLEAAHSNGSWPWKRYLLRLENFDPEEFLSFGANSVDVGIFMFFMSLSQPCHFELFSYLVSKRGALTYALRNKYSDLILILSESDQAMLPLLEMHLEIFSLEVVNHLFQNGLITSDQYELAISRFSAVYLILFKIWSFIAWLLDCFFVQLFKDQKGKTEQIPFGRNEIARE